MIISLAYIALALVLLFGGADSLVRGSASLALRAGVSSLLVGLTVVAFGTSSPELLVSVKAALSAQGDISVGNVIGSISFNIGIILGLTALICPIPVHFQLIKIDAPIALGAALLLPVLLLNQLLGRVEGTILLTGMLAYTWMRLTLGRRTSADITEVAASSAVLRHWTLDIAFIAAGVGILVLGTHLLIQHSVALAKYLGASEAVIGLTVIAVGTSIPELATSLVAALRKQPDIAVGNIVGSNICNILMILGVASTIKPLHVQGITNLDYSFMIGFSVLLIPMLYTGRTLHRIEGAGLLSLYGLYLFLLWFA